jgi:hypothetical protein
MKHYIIGVVLLCAFALLTACSTPMFTMPPGTPEYRTAFHDGCDAGYAYAGSPFYAQGHATNPPPSDQTYAAGWYAGFEQCRVNYQHIQWTTFNIIGPP